MKTRSTQDLTVRRALLGTLAAATVMASLLQVPIDASVENIECVCWVLASSFSILLYIGYTNAIEQQPLSTFAIFGFCATTQLGALLFQTAYWTPLRSSLYDPHLTFSTLAIYQGIATSVHAAYRFFSFASPVETRMLRRGLGWLGLYETPSAATLWIMGYIGVLGFIIGTNSGIGGKVADGFRFLTWAPFLIPIYYRRVGNSYCNARITKFLLIVFSLLIVFLGMGLNYRQIMFFGVATIALLFMLSGLRSKSEVIPSVVLKLAVAAAALLALSGPTSDLATAMAVARAHRGKITELAMISTTFDVWLHRPYLITAFRAEEKADLSYSGYDESYIANPLLARLVETKFHDNSLHFGELLSSGDIEDLERFTMNSFWDVFPEPVLRSFGIVAKDEFSTATLGDYLAYLSRGTPLGGLKTGSVLAQGRVLLGPLFPFVYALICLLLFAVMDLLTIRSALVPASLSAVGMMKIWQLFIYGITADSFEAIEIFICREVPQMIAIYCIILGLSKLFLPNRRATQSESGAYARQRAA